MCDTADLPSTQPPYWPFVWEKKVDIADPSVSQYLALLQSERDHYKVDYQRPTLGTQLGNAPHWTPYMGNHVAFSLLAWIRL